MADAVAYRLSARRSPDGAVLRGVVPPGTTHRMSVTYAEASRIVHRTARLLRDEYGVGEGDRVAVLAPNAVAYVLLFFAVHEGKLAGVDDLIRPYVQQLFGQDLIEKDRTMTFRHLADMVSGYALSEAPGAAWGYNDYAINLYAKVLFDAVFEQTPNDAALDPSRLAPLQFEDGSIFGSRQGYGVNASVRDFARLGWFWLNRGNWNGQQLLPASFFDAYVQPDVVGTLPRTQGGGQDYLEVYFTGGGRDQTPYGPGIYGFNWWFNTPVGTGSTLHWPDGPADAYQANGYWGERVVTVIPSLNMVVATWGSWGSFAPGDAQAGHNQHLKMLGDAVLPPTPADTLAVSDGWNLLGLPLEVPDPHYQAVFDEQATSEPYAYDQGAGYGSEPALEPGAGYWTLFDEAETMTPEGTPQTEISIDVAEGWNLVAGPGCEMPVADIASSPPGLVASDFYGHGSEGYFAESTALQPWNGYWVLSTGAGTLTLTCP